MFRLLLTFLAVLAFASSCSNFIASREASADSSTLIAYNADSGNLYGQLYHYEARKNIPKGTKRQIFEWDTGKYLGEIDEAEETYNVVGNQNEYGLSIGETTFGGNAKLQSQEGAIMDYGNLIWVTLQRSKTAREAIQTMDALCQKYGYYSEGEGFSIADGEEAWHMELIGKGNGQKGSVWVAKKLPAGAIAAHANQARITTFDQNDSETTLYAKDVISFAREQGLYEGDDKDFSFSDAYDPVTFSGARFCEARVWEMFSKFLPADSGFQAQYEDYAMGYNLTNRMPLFVYPAKGSVTLQSVSDLFRSHYEDSILDMSGTVKKNDLGAQGDNNAYRAHPLTWEYSDKTYLNERPIGTQQTGWNFIAQTRSWMPYPLKGVFWFGVDDSSTTVRVPFYGSANKVPIGWGGKGTQDGVVSPMMTFSMDKAFYAFNVVANWAYSRWGLMKDDLIKKISHKEEHYQQAVKSVDENALYMLGQGDAKSVEKVVEYVTAFSDKEGTTLLKEWNDFFGHLFVKYRDGYVIEANADDTACGCTVNNGEYSKTFYGHIVKAAGDFFQVPSDEKTLTSTSTEQIDKNRKNTVCKASLLSRR